MSANQRNDASRRVGGAVLPDADTAVGKGIAGQISTALGFVEDLVSAFANLVVDDPRAFAERHLGPVDRHRFLQLGAVAGVQQFDGLPRGGKLFGDGFC